MKCDLKHLRLFLLILLILSLDYFYSTFADICVSKVKSLTNCLCAKKKAEASYIKENKFAQNHIRKFIQVSWQDFTSKGPKNSFLWLHPFTVIGLCFRKQFKEILLFLLRGEGNEYESTKKKINNVILFRKE